MWTSPASSSGWRCTPSLRRLDEGGATGRPPSLIDSRGDAARCLYVWPHRQHVICRLGRRSAQHRWHGLTAAGACGGHKPAAFERGCHPAHPPCKQRGTRLIPGRSRHRPRWLGPEASSRHAAGSLPGRGRSGCHRCGHGRTGPGRVAVLSATGLGRLEIATRQRCPDHRQALEVCHRICRTLASTAEFRAAGATASIGVVVDVPAKISLADLKRLAAAAMLRVKNVRSADNGIAVCRPSDVAWFGATRSQGQG